MPELPLHDALAMRRADAKTLMAALDDAQARLLAVAQAYRAQLGPALEVPCAAELNPPRWELGHIAWFEEWWIARNPQRLAGSAADPQAPRAAPLRAQADALYDSSRVPHARRWQLDLPDFGRTLDDARRVRERTLRLLAGSAGDDDALYFPRLCLFHQDMHTEAWVYMAQRLGIDLSPALPRSGPAAQEDADAPQIELAARILRLGSDGPGFAFDNECGAQEIELPAFAIDARPVSWRRYLPFVEAGGYDDERLWSRAGWAWRRRQGQAAPRYLERDEDGAWWRTSFGRRAPLDLDAPAMHVCQHEAQAWCAWAGRRLPSEAEWEAAALHGGPRFEWGQVWEWTASAFAPYPGFAPHPYRDYSAPWFDGRPVLRGASWATAARMKHPRYRNYFPAERNDLFAGLRSCAR